MTYAKPAEMALRKPVALAVDDDPIMREILHELLTQHGYDCASAEDGDVALWSLRTRPADLVVLDMIMPNREGIETLRDIKLRWPGTRVIMISGGTQAMAAGPLLAMAKGLGADAVMLKPLQGAAFLSQFVADGVPWAHFDIAGAAYHTGGRYAYNPDKGASGFAVRMFTDLVQAIF